MVVLDTSLLIDLERDVPNAWGLIDGFANGREHMRVPAAVWIEYLAAMTSLPRTRAVEELQASVTFEPFSRELAEEAVVLQHDLFACGSPLGWHDLQVAATARWHHEVLATRDAGFKDIPGLRVLAW